MLAVVVLLTKPQIHVIVPDKYIYGLDKLEPQLKTWGVNKQHKHVIFWKRSFLDDNETPDSIDPADFHLVPCYNFPPPTAIDTACFFGCVKRFFTSFDEAKQYRDKFRPILPRVYNAAILNNQPIPPSPNNSDQSTENSEDKFVLRAVELDDSDTFAIENLLDMNESVSSNFDEEQTQDNNLSGFSDDDQSENFGNVEHNQNNAFVSIAVVIQPEKATTNAYVSSDEEQTLSTNTIHAMHSAEVDEAEINAETQFNAQKSPQSSSTSMNDDDDGAAKQVRVTQTINYEGEEIEISYVSGQKLRPIINSALVKVNDLLSGNLPFQENVEKDRSYLVEVENGFKEVKIKGRVVDFLSNLNANRRNDSKADFPFIKALIVSVFTVKLVKAKGTLQPDLIDFIKDLFAVRVGNDSGNRSQSFNKLMSLGCSEIRNS